MKSRLLLVEDEEALQWTLEEVFRKEGYTVFACSTGEEARRVLRGESIHVALLDVRLPDVSGLDLFRQIQSHDVGTPCILMTAYPRTTEAVQALKEGAHDYVVKPFELAHVRQIVDKAAEYVRLRAEVSHLRDHRRARSRFMGRGPRSRKLLELIDRVAASASTHVLVRGETGAGKELVAELLHRNSPRREGPFVALNCSALPGDLVEAELFGHEKGAYTGAQTEKKGLLELADGGTLFLDEVGDLPVPLQPKLLRVLDGSPFRRIGGRRNIQSDVRFVAATNRDLEEAVRKRLFREDLLFRLKVFEVRVPPLRERPEDIPLLAEHFLKVLGPKVGRIGAVLDEEALALLRGYSWPGNVRELRNVIERGLILAEGGRVKASSLPAELTFPAPGQETARDWSLEEAKRRHVLSVLERCGQNRSEAARCLGISRSTLKTLLRKYRES